VVIVLFGILVATMNTSVYPNTIVLLIVAGAAPLSSAASRRSWYGHGRPRIAMARAFSRTGAPGPGFPHSGEPRSLGLRRSCPLS